MHGEEGEILSSPEHSPVEKTRVVVIKDDDCGAMNSASSEPSAMKMDESVVCIEDISDPPIIKIQGNTEGEDMFISSDDDHERKEKEPSVIEISDNFPEKSPIPDPHDKSVDDTDLYGDLEFPEKHLPKIESSSILFQTEKQFTDSIKGSNTPNDADAEIDHLEISAPQPSVSKKSASKDHTDRYERWRDGNLKESTSNSKLHREHTDRLDRKRAYTIDDERERDRDRNSDRARHSGSDSDGRRREEKKRDQDRKQRDESDDLRRKLIKKIEATREQRRLEGQRDQQREQQQKKEEERKENERKEKIQEEARLEREEQRQKERDQRQEEQEKRKERDKLNYEAKLEFDKFKEKLLAQKDMLLESVKKSNESKVVTSQTSDSSSNYQTDTNPPAGLDSDSDDAKDSRSRRKEEKSRRKKKKKDKSKDKDRRGEKRKSVPSLETNSNKNEIKVETVGPKEIVEEEMSGDEPLLAKDVDSISESLSPSPPPLKKRTFFPGIEGCRKVEEFRWLNRIEEGTYGVVYRAEDNHTKEIVALKRLKMEKEREGFPITSLREINTLLKAQHPNIVTVREIVVGSNMDKIYIVMDYVEHDLKSLMSIMTTPFLVGEVKTLMIQLLKGVHHLHDNWILHRDIKASNLLLSHKGILKIGDFGLAREYGSPLKRYTSVVVTLWYRAPELLLGAKEYSTAIDMWSVGCVMAELLTMKPLFTGHSEIDQINRIFKELGTPNDKIWPGPPCYTEMPNVKKMNIAEHPYNKLRQRFGASMTDHGFDSLNRFLSYDPAKRITAEEALKHQYFEEDPRPVPPSLFPTWPAKSELGAKAVKKNASPKPPEGGGEFRGLGEGEEVLGGFHMPAATKGISTKGMGFNLKF